MASPTTSQAAPLTVGRRIGFVVVTLAAFVLDVLTVVPDAEERDGRWVPWAGWEPTVLEFVAIMAVVYAVLLLRRRWPLVVLVVMCAVSLPLALAPVPSLPVVGTLVSLYTASALLDERWQAWGALGLTVVVQTVGLVLLPTPDDNDLWIAAVLLAGVSFLMWVFGRREHDATLAAAGLDDQLAQHGAEAAAQERRRIARELHDIVAHSVSAMMMQAAGAKAVTTGLRQDKAQDPRLEMVEQALATIENTGSQSMRELHRLLGVLRGDELATDAGDPESGSQPGMEDIAPLVELTRRSGLVVEVHIAGEPTRMDPSVGLAAYRIVQECLTNAMKHGGRGAVVDIFLSWQPVHLQLQVRSRAGHEGAQSGSVAGGNGLIGLRERVELIGGTFESGWVGEEFVATAALPLTSPARPSGSSDGDDPRPGHPLTGGPDGELHGGDRLESRLTR